MPKVKFIVDIEYDAMTTWNMLHMQDPAGRESRIASMRMSANDAKKLIDTDTFEEAKDFAIEYLEKRHAAKRQQIQRAKKDYQREWDKINDVFFDKTKALTEHAWTHPTYKVVLSPLNEGVSDMRGDTVVRSALEDSKDQLRITAHELLMHHTWHVIWKLFPESEENPSFEYWAANELVTNAVLGLDPGFKDLWSKKTRGYDKYLRNYPQLDEVKMLLKDEYKEKRSFKDFMKEAYKKVATSSGTLDETIHLFPRGIT